MTDRTQVYEDALRAIAACVQEARRATPLGSFTLRPGVGEKLLNDLELELSRMVVVAMDPTLQRPALGGTCHCDGPAHQWSPGWCPASGPR